MHLQFAANDTVGPTDKLCARAILEPASIRALHAGSPCLTPIADPSTTHLLSWQSSGLRSHQTHNAQRSTWTKILTVTSTSLQPSFTSLRTCADAQPPPEQHHYSPHTTHANQSALLLQNNPVHLTWQRHFSPTPALLVYLTPRTARASSLA